MPRTAKTYHQHITPEGRVLKCDNPDNCPYKGAVHIEATLKQAKFMEETIRAGKEAKTKEIESKTESNVVTANWHGDEIVAIPQENGRYIIKLASGRVLAADAGLISGVSKEDAIKDWAQNMAPFGAKKVEYPISPQTSNVQEITVYDELSDSDVSVGYVFFQPGRGWTNIADMEELVAHAPGEKWGLLTAAAAAEDAYRSRVAYDVALEAGVEPTFTRERTDGHRHNWVEYKQSDRSFGQRCTLCGTTSGRAITQNDGHEHVWEPYFSGSRCAKCGKKAGYDKLNQNPRATRQATSLVDPASEMSPAVKNAMLDMVADRKAAGSKVDEAVQVIRTAREIEEQAEQDLRVRGAKVLYEDDAARALGRLPKAEDRVYAARNDLTAQVRKAFAATRDPRTLKADEGDGVYVHEVRDLDDNHVESVTVKWGARSWSHEAITFDNMGEETPYTEFQNWLNRHNK